MVFYLVPYAFLFQEFAVFFLVMELIFAAMVAGVCCMVQPLLPLMEKVVLFCVLWGHDRRFKSTIRLDPRRIDEAERWLQWKPVGTQVTFYEGGARCHIERCIYYI